MAENKPDAAAKSAAPGPGAKPATKPAATKAAAKKAPAKKAGAKKKATDCSSPIDSRQKGSCHKGPDCRFLHRVPFAADLRRVRVARRVQAAYQFGGCIRRNGGEQSAGGLFDQFRKGTMGGLDDGDAVRQGFQYEDPLGFLVVDLVLDLLGKVCCRRPFFWRCEWISGLSGGRRRAKF